MSTQYFPYCKTCDSKHDDFPEDRLDDACRALIKYPKLIAALKPLIDDKLSGYHRIILVVGEPHSFYNRVNVDWFAQHAEHELAVMTEYGNLVEECGRYYDCIACGEKHQHKCKMPSNHSPPCGHRR